MDSFNNPLSNKQLKFNIVNRKLQIKVTFKLSQNVHIANTAGN